MCVLLTRSEKENLLLCAELVKLGIPSTSSPLFEYTSINIDWRYVEQYPYIIITSKFASRLAALHIKSAINAWVVGNASASILLTNKYITVDAVFQSVAACMQQLAITKNDYMLSKQFLYLRGNICKANIPTANCIIYTTNYATQLTDRAVEAIKNNQIKVIMLYSAHAANILYKLACAQHVWDILRHVNYVVLSKEIGLTLFALGAPNVMWASNNCNKSMIASAASFYNHSSRIITV